MATTRAQFIADGKTYFLIRWCLDDPAHVEELLSEAWDSGIRNPIEFADEHAEDCDFDDPLDFLYRSEGASFHRKIDELRKKYPT